LAQQIHHQGILLNSGICHIACIFLYYDATLNINMANKFCNFLLV
jgi:hypothetical protein